MVRKNKAVIHPNLHPKGTLSTILTIKFANTEPAHCFKPSKELLKRAKSATHTQENKLIAFVIHFSCDLFTIVVQLINVDKGGSISCMSVLPKLRAQQISLPWNM